MARKRDDTGLRQRHGLRCPGTKDCGCPWEASVYSKVDDRKVRRTFPTRAAAQSWRDDKLHAARRGELRAPDGRTLAEAWSEWHEQAKAGIVRPPSREPYKPASLRAYDQHMRLRVLPELGHRKLHEIEPEHLQDLVERWIADDLSPSVIEATITPLRALYKRALRRRSSGLTRNPTKGLEVPHRGEGRKVERDRSEVSRLLAALPDGERAIWATAMYAGLRRGELMALRVEDVDLSSGVIRVSRNWDRYEGEIAPKSRKGRTVPIAGALRSHLAAHLLALGWSEGLIFGVSPTSPFKIATVAYRADAAWKRAKLERLTLHECRHLYASLSIAAGVNAKALQTYMGHATITITMDRYGHLMRGNEREAAALLDRYLSVASGQ